MASPFSATPASAALVAYVQAWERLSPDSLDALDDVTTANVRFVDPFNDVTGRDALKAVLHHMYTTVDSPRFQVLEQAEAPGGGMLRWRFTAKVPVLGTWDVTGMSFVTLDGEGRVTTHTDYWDTGPVLWLRLPVLGAVLRRIARRFRVRT